MIYRKFNVVNFVTFLLFLVHVIEVAVKGKNGCKDLVYLPCLQNKTFKSHVIESFRLLVPGLVECQSKCFKQDKCVSYNLGPISGKVRTCELNEYDHVTRPNDVIEMKGSEYCPIKSPCSSNPCSGKICIPDFYWNSFSCRNGVWSEWSVWSLCNCPSRTPHRIRRCRNPFTNATATDCPGTGQEISQAVCTPIKGCTVSNALGMEDGRIKDRQINASSTHQDCRTSRARLNLETHAAGWCAGKGKGDYIEIDLGTIKTVTKIATQARYNVNQWVTKYTIAYYCDEVQPLWITYTKPGTNYPKYFSGNVDKINTVENVLPIPIKTRHIRLIVQEFYAYPSLRMELYGC